MSLTKWIPAFAGMTGCGIDASAEAGIVTPAKAGVQDWLCADRIPGTHLDVGQE